MNWRQLLALIKVRFQLTKNQVGKGGRFNALLYSIVCFVAMGLSMVAFFVAAWGGYFLFGRIRDPGIFFVWNLVTVSVAAVAFFDFIGTIQKNDVIEIERLLHLPTRFGGAFVINFLSSMVNFQTMVLFPAIMGLAVAMPLAKGWSCAVAVPLAAAFILMIFSATYWARAWLMARAQNQRVRGWLAIALPFAMIAVFMLVAEYADFVSPYSFLGKSPVGPISLGIESAMTDGSLVNAALGTCSMLAVAAGALVFSWRSSLKKLTGESSAATANTKSAKSEDWINMRQFTQLPLMSPYASAVANCTIKSLLRAPEVLAALLPVAAALFLGAPYLLGWEGYEVSELVRESIPMMSIFLTLIGFPAFLFSTFSYDRDGFRAYVLSPAPRKEILHGHNVGIGILTFACGAATLGLVQCFFPCGPGWFLGHLIQILSSYLLLALLGNLISVFLPIGFKRGSMTPVNVKILPMVAIYVGVLIGPALAMTPTSICWSLAKLLYFSSISFPSGWAYLLLSLVQLGIVLPVYKLCQAPLGNSLWDQETEIVQVVANIPE